MKRLDIVLFTMECGYAAEYLMTEVETIRMR